MLGDREVNVVEPIVERDGTIREEGNTDLNFFFENHFPLLGRGWSIGTQEALGISSEGYWH